MNLPLAYSRFEMYQISMLGEQEQKLKSIYYSMCPILIAVRVCIRVQRYEKFGLHRNHLIHPDVERL